MSWVLCIFCACVVVNIYCIARVGLICVFQNFCKMESFDVEEYCSTFSTHNELFKLNKGNLMAIAQYYELATGPRMNVVEAIQLIGDRLNLPDPEKAAAARLR